MLPLITGFLCSIVFLGATDLEKEKSLHENFWNNIIKDYEVETKTQANSRNRVLTEFEKLHMKDNTNLPSIVIDVSAILVATTTFRIPFLGT